MTLTAIEQSSSFLAQLANPAARALVLAGGAGLGLAAFRVRSASARLFTWTAVLYAALALPLLGWLLPPLAVPTPAFLHSGAWQVNVVQEPRVEASLPSVASSIPPRVVRASSPSSVSGMGRMTRTAPRVDVPPATSISFLALPFWRSIRWSVVATAIYLAVALLLLMRIVVGLVYSHRMIQASQAIHDPRLSERLASRAHASGLTALPQAAESELISVPLTIGVQRSTILLPPGWQAWGDAKLDAVVAHEVSHVVRRDTLTQRLSLLHRAIFWFSPLAWWLDRHLAELAEQASDETALSCGADRNDYARTLLGFFEALQAAPGRVWWQGVAMAKAGQAEQRLERILAWRGAVTMSLKKSFAFVIIALAIPVVYLAASVRPAYSNPRAQGLTPPPTARPATAPPAQAEATPAPPAVASPEPDAAAPPWSTDAEPAPPAAPASAPVMPPGPAAPAAGGVWNSGPPPIRPTPALAPVAPMAPVGPVPPVFAIAAQTGRGHGSGHGRGYSYAYGHDDEQRFVIVSGKSDSYMSGSTEDIRHVEKLKKQIPGDFIWFQRDEKSYIIRDPATIDRARKLWAPQEELGRKQEELGKQQEALGKQQEELSAKMEQVRVKVPDMTAELDKLKAELKQLSSGATMEDVGRIQSEIGELQSKIGEIQSHAGDQQSKLGEEMGALGEKQGKLGEQQGELGRQQGELAEKASRQMKELLDEAIKNGTAKPEPETGDGATL